MISADAHAYRQVMAMHESGRRPGPSIRAALLRPPRRRSLDVVRLGVTSLAAGLYLGYLLGATVWWPWWGPALIVVAGLCWVWAEVLPARIERFVAPLRILGYALFAAALIGFWTVAITRGT